MLNQLKIEKLFGLYDYDIDLTNDDGSMVKFITAPNGYGKTTILDFIDGMMKKSYDKMFEIPFGTFTMFFRENGSDEKYHVAVQRSDDESDSSDSDVNGIVAIKLAISLAKTIGSEEKLVERFVVIRYADGRVETLGDTSNLDMFFVSRTCHYITDTRLLKRKTDADDEVAAMETISMARYAADMRRILQSPVLKREYAARIDVFKRVIDRCEFASKHIEIDERFGIRFVAHDELETKLSLDQLSSGERHVIIQVYELLFKAQDGTLVMIDEPELSLHMMWQMNYLKNLEEIINLRGFHCIVATHSPQIFNALWSKSVDLFTLTQGSPHAEIS
ncbi:MAG: ATP-binding protein [Lentisphaeria bacterium]|nr:ATP-binding protein [Lentisphaeria bacterium]